MVCLVSVKNAFNQIIIAVVLRSKSGKREAIVGKNYNAKSEAVSLLIISQFWVGCSVGMPFCE